MVNIIYNHAAHYYLDEDNQQDDYDISNGGVVQSARFVTVREYYCFLLQAREGVLISCYLEGDFSNNGLLTCISRLSL
jgi:hypothetical protein